MARPTSGALSSQFSLLAAIKSCVAWLNRLIFPFEKRYNNVELSLHSRHLTSTYIDVLQQKPISQCRCPNYDTADQYRMEWLTALKKYGPLSFSTSPHHTTTTFALVEHTDLLSVTHVDTVWHECRHTLHRIFRESHYTQSQEIANMATY